MHEPVRVAVLERARELDGDVARLGIRQRPLVITLVPVVEVRVGALEHEVHKVGRVQRLDEPVDVLVRRELAQRLDLKPGPVDRADRAPQAAVLRELRGCGPSVAGRRHRGAADGAGMETVRSSSRVVWSRGRV